MLLVSTRIRRQVCQYAVKNKKRKKTNTCHWDHTGGPIKRAKIPPKISSLGSGRLLALDRDGALKGLEYAVLSP